MKILAFEELCKLANTIYATGVIPKGPTQMKRAAIEQKPGNQRKDEIRSVLRMVSLTARMRARSKRTEPQLEAMETGRWRILLRISWTRTKSNDNMLDMAGEQRSLLRNIRKLQLSYV